VKPLVYYCRWQGASLRLRGRDDTAVWGQLVFTENGEERSQSFRFNLKSWQITLSVADSEKTLQLDEMGTVVNEAQET
jgi:hypothetical protein